MLVFEKNIGTKRSRTLETYPAFVGIQILGTQLDVIFMQDVLDEKGRVGTRTFGPLLTSHSIYHAVGWEASPIPAGGIGARAPASAPLVPILPLFRFLLLL